MADDLPFEVVLTGWKEMIAALDELERVADRANMWALRAAGRKLKQAARRNAPVGPASDDHRGQLKKSISSSRQLRGSRAAGWSLTVGPHTDYAFSNASRDRGDNTYMQRALAEGEAAMAAAYQEAFTRVFARYSK